MTGGKKEIYRDVRFFHGALQVVCHSGMIGYTWLPWLDYKGTKGRHRGGADSP